MPGFVSCSNDGDSVCTKCMGGWTGAACQHEPVIPGIDYNLCSGNGYVEAPDCEGGGCVGEKWMVDGVQVGPHYRWTTGECIWYPAGKARGIMAPSMDLRSTGEGLGEHGSSAAVMQGDKITGRENYSQEEQEAKFTMTSEQFRDENFAPDWEKRRRPAARVDARDGAGHGRAADQAAERQPQH